MIKVLPITLFLSWLNEGNSIWASRSRRSLDTINDLLQSLDAVKSEIDSNLFLYQTPDFQWIPSTVYRYDDFRESLNIMATEGVAGKTFYIGEDVQNGHVYGLVNIAAFLAQSMKETIQYDACDENSWDLVNGKYPLSNACGQLGQSYQDYHCSEEEKHMECPVDPNMSITAVTHAKWYGAPGPLFCGPKTEEQPFTGYWDYTYECNKAWANPPETCDVYEDQKAGRYDQSVAVANTAGRTDVEGCCWWGRGVIQTSGVCNFGKLNYFLGAGAAKDGRTSRYPNIDFCKDPEVICNSSEYKELKWIAGMFYWIESVQNYNQEGWDYLTELRAFVEGGMSDTRFIDGVSGIVNRGCHNPPCATGAVDGSYERSDNFKKVLYTFFQESPPDVFSQEILSETPSSEVMLPDTNTAVNILHADEPLGATTTYPISLENSSITSANKEESTLLDENHATSHDNETPTSILVYSCGDHTDPRINTVAVDIPYRYNAFISRKVLGNDAVQEVNNKIMQDLGSLLGCSTTSLRHLRQMTEYGTITGFQSVPDDEDLSDEHAFSSSCGGLMIDPMLVCISATSRLTAFIDDNASADAVEASTNFILSTIEDGMQNDRYTSIDVKYVVFSGEKSNNITREKSNNNFSSIQSSEFSDESSSYSPIWIPVLVVLTILLVMAVNVTFIRRYRQSTDFARVRSHPKTLASFVSNLENIPTPKIDSSHSSGSDSIDASNLDCFEELSAPPFVRTDYDESSLSNHFSMQSKSESEIIDNDSSQGNVVVYISSESSSLCERTTYSTPLK